MPPPALAALAASGFDVVLALAAVAAAVAAGLAAGAAWTLVTRMRELGARAAPLEHLATLSRDVRTLCEARGDLDLRRVEHLLIELRDSQARLEDSLLRHAEATREALVRGEGTAALAAPAGDGLGERAVNRLIAMGYERIQLVTRHEKLLELVARDGEILVEANKAGVLHKGRVLVRSGRIANVELHPAYSIFP